MERVIEFIKDLFRCQHVARECISIKCIEIGDGEKVIETTWFCLVCGVEFTEYRKYDN